MKCIIKCNQILRTISNENSNTQLYLAQLCMVCFKRMKQFVIICAPLSDTKCAVLLLFSSRIVQEAYCDTFYRAHHIFTDGALSGSAVHTEQ